MNREKLIEQVRALRNIAVDKAATLEEAATAARIAEKMIQENQLAEADLEISAGPQEKVIEDSTPLTDWNQKQTVWHNCLLTALCRAYNCEGMIHHRDGKVNFYAIGRPSDIDTVRYQFTWFVLELTRLAHTLAPKTLQRGGGKHWHKSFYMGGMNAIVEALKSAKQEVQAQASSTALAVLNSHYEEALAFAKKINPRLRDKMFHGPVDMGAYEMGRRAGAGLNIRPGLETGTKALLNK